MSSEAELSAYLCNILAVEGTLLIDVSYVQSYSVIWNLTDLPPSYSARGSPEMSLLTFAFAGMHLLHQAVQQHSTEQLNQKSAAASFQSARRCQEALRPRSCTRAAGGCPQLCSVVSN